LVNARLNNLIAIVGPTGSGKSDLALQLARMFDGEIINADSRQLLKYLDIGTAKPDLVTRGEVPHHLFDLSTPAQDFNLADFQQLAYQTINEIIKRGNLPVLVGGSGLYLWTVLEGWQIPRISPNSGLRQTLEARANIEGIEALFRELTQLDPEAASHIDARNARRVIRALEVRLGTTLGNGNQRTKQIPPYRMLIIGLTAPRDVLYRRIDARVDKMLEKGLVEEVESVLSMGFASDAAGFRSVGYKEVVSYLKGELDLGETLDRIKAETHRLVRHQYNWFRLNDQRIHWFNIETNFLDGATQLITEFLEEKKSEYGFY
jgi:tRNA dimethylallyltransferase